MPYEYIAELCSLGMRVDEAYTVVNDFFREWDIEGLKDYIRYFRVIRETLRESVG